MKKKWAKIIGGILLTVLLLGGGGMLWYLNDYYHVMSEAKETLVESERDLIQVSQTKEGYTVFIPENPERGFIFYPGGKVEALAYAPFLKELAEHGVLCVLVEMPFRLAVFDSDAAEGIPEQFSQITTWYLGGHSLGGAMAANYISEHANRFQGLILLAAYSVADLSDTDLQVLTIVGSNDKVVDKEKLESSKANLPDSKKDVLIEGGCHSYFGYYGDQAGDGTPTITREEQISQTVEAIVDLWK